MSSEECISSIYFLSSTVGYTVAPYLDVAHVTIFRSFKDDTGDEWATYLPDADNILSHQYDQVGVFWTTVTAVNSVGEWLATIPTPMRVQHPIVGFWFNCCEYFSFMDKHGRELFVDSVIFIQYSYMYLYIELQLYLYRELSYLAHRHH